MPARERNVEDAFAAFELTLRDHLAGEARRAVEQALAKLARGGGPIRALGAEVNVDIRSLRLEAVPAHEAQRPRGASGRGRPPGALRTALMNAFTGPVDTLDVETLRARVEGAGLTITTDNLHQHLRRLVLAGELERAGRGVYRRT